MPEYPYLCPNGHRFSKFRSVTEQRLGTAKCPHCRSYANQDYAAKRPQVGFIDGPSTGYYGPDFPSANDPERPLLKVMPNKQAWDRHVKSNPNIKDLS